MTCHWKLINLHNWNIYKIVARKFFLVVVVAVSLSQRACRNSYKASTSIDRMDACSGLAPYLKGIVYPQLKFHPFTCHPICRWKVWRHVLIHITIVEFHGGKDFNQWSPLCSKTPKGEKINTDEKHNTSPCYSCGVIQKPETLGSPVCCKTVPVTLYWQPKYPLQPRSQELHSSGSHKYGKLQ